MGLPTSLLQISRYLIPAGLLLDKRWALVSIRECAGSSGCRISRYYAAPLPLCATSRPPASKWGAYFEDEIGNTMLTAIPAERVARPSTRAA